MAKFNNYPKIETPKGDNSLNGYVPPKDINTFKGEIENTILSGDIELTDEVDNQASAIANITSRCQYYIDETLDYSNFIINTPTPFIGCKKYYDGMIILFLSKGNNKENATISVNNLAIKNIYPDLENIQLNADEIKENEYTQLIYNANKDAFIVLKLAGSGGNGGGGYIGQVSYGIRKDVPEGQVRADGTSRLREGFWVDLVDNYIKTDLLPTITDAEYEAELLANDGNCGFFAWNEDTQMFRVPTIKDKIYITTALTLGDIGKFVKAGLPNITGQVNNFCSGPHTGGIGAMSESTQSYGFAAGGSAILYGNTIIINASKSNSIYGRSNTVLTNAIQYPVFICVSTGGGGGSGVSDYEKLQNKPTIEGKIISGNLEASDLGLQKQLTAGTGIEINETTGEIKASSSGISSGITVDGKELTQTELNVLLYDLYKAVKESGAFVGTING